MMSMTECPFVHNIGPPEPLLEASESGIVVDAFSSKGISNDRAWTNWGGERITMASEIYT